MERQRKIANHFRYQPRLKAFFIIAFVITAFTSFSRAYNFAPFINQVFEYTGYTGGGGNGALTIVSSGIPGAHGPANPYYMNPETSALASDVAAGATTLTATTSTILAGWNVLVIQMKGPTAGIYEFVDTAAGTSGTTIVFASALKNSYSASNKTQIIRVMHYTNVTMNSGSYLTTSAWNGSTGGVLVFKATGTVDLSDGGGGLPATISMGQDSSANLAGGFAGGSSGTHGEAAFNKSTGASGTLDGSSDGTALSPASPTYLISGSGGNGTLNGGRGGGIVIIKAATINLGGRIIASGGNYSSASGQGGSGGSIYVAAGTLQKGSYTSCGSFISNAGTSSSTPNATAGPIFVYYQTTLGTGCENRGTPSANTTYRLFSVH